MKTLISQDLLPMIYAAGGQVMIDCGFVVKLLVLFVGPADGGKCYGTATP